MSSSTSRPTVTLDLISTEAPLALDTLPTRAQQSASHAAHLALFPDKLGQVRVRIRNHGDEELALKLKLQGSFPSEWVQAQFNLDHISPIAWLLIHEYHCLAGIFFLQELGYLHREWQYVDGSWATQAFILPPKQNLSKAISFQAPEDFFEQQNALAQNTKTDSLNLTYQGNVSLLTSSGAHAEQELVGYKSVNFYVQPFCSYLDFLPEIYRESDFLARMLAIFEQSFEPTVQAMDNFWAYLDPLTAPKALLPFLASAVAWPMNPQLSLKLQRRLIRHAVQLYQWRGSRKGLQFALHLCTGLPNDDAYIKIRDTDGMEFSIGHVTLGAEPSLGGGQAFHFSVTLNTDFQGGEIEINESSIRSIIEQEKPAFCTYALEII